MFYFIRHAESVFNKQHRSLKKHHEQNNHEHHHLKVRHQQKGHHGHHHQKQNHQNLHNDHQLCEQNQGTFDYRLSQEYISFKFDPKFADCGLTQYGRQQCLTAKQKFQEVDIDLVLVSPMRRTLQTCDLIFKDHPKKPKIMVWLDGRQKFKSSCDVGNRLLQSMEQWRNYDFSKVEHPQYWYVDNLKNVQHRQMLLQKINKIYQQNIEDNLRNISSNVMIDYLKQQYINQTKHQQQQKLKHKNKQENQQKHKNDSIIIEKQDQKKKEKQFLKNLIKQYKNIAIVSHCTTIKSFIKERLTNCQIAPVHESQL